MPYLAVTLKKVLPLSKKHSDKAWKKGSVWMSPGFHNAIPSCQTKFGFQSPDTAHIQMQEHMPLMSGAGLGAETWICIYETVKPTLLRI